MVNFFINSINNAIEDGKKEKATASLTADQQLMINNIMAAIDKNKDK